MEEETDLEGMIDFAWRSFLNLQSTIDLFDRKASAGMAFAGALVVALGALASRFDIKSWLATQHGWAMGISALLCFICIFAYASYVYFCVYVLWSRSPSSKTKSLVYFKDIVSHNDADDYLKAVKQLSAEKLFQDITTQVFEVSKIANTKMKGINNAILSLTIVLISWLITLLFMM